MGFLILLTLTMIIRVPVYGLMTKEKLEALVKQKNMQEGITYTKRNLELH